MSIPKRYADSRSGIPTGANVPDFIVRRRSPAVLTLAVVLFGTLIACIGIAFTIDDRTHLMMLLFSLIGAAAWYATLTVQRSYDLLMATEFQNALFSSAIGINHKFCLIIKQDGVITYLDRAFQDMFPNFLRQSNRTVDSWLEHGKVSREDREEIMAAIDRGGFGRAIFVMRSAGDEYHKIVMSVEPILRPHGFILLRGREFVEKRTDESTPHNDRIQKASLALFSRITSKVNLGMFTAGALGNITYINPVLENWLGYPNGEVISSGLALKDIVLGDDTGVIRELADREEAVSLQKKDGSKISAVLHQQVVKDDNGKVAAAAGLIQLT